MLVPISTQESGALSLAGVICYLHWPRVDTIAVSSHETITIFFPLQEPVTWEIGESVDVGLAVGQHNLGRLSHDDPDVCYSN